MDLATRVIGRALRHNTRKTGLVVSSRTMNIYSSRPVVLCLSGHDPSGGAGLQADIEALLAQGCHAAPAVTALTVQDTVNVTDFRVLDREWVLARPMPCSTTPKSRR